MLDDGVVAARGRLADRRTMGGALHNSKYYAVIDTVLRTYGSDRDGILLIDYGSTGIRSSRKCNGGAYLAISVGFVNRCDRVRDGCVSARRFVAGVDDGMAGAA